jgi:hypothetical protein
MKQDTLLINVSQKYQSHARCDQPFSTSFSLESQFFASNYVNAYPLDYLRILLV